MKFAKKITAAVTMLFMLSTTVLVPSAKETTLGMDKATLSGGSFSLEDDNVGAYIAEGGYAGFKGVSLTGMKSVTVTALCNSIGDGDLIMVRIDSPSGKCIGKIDLGIGEDYADYTASLKATEGVHDVYLVSLLSTQSTKIKSVKFSEEEYNYTYTPVDESKITDKRADTWALTDSLGRRMADYEEAGDLKEGKAVGICYWTWHNLNPSTEPINNSEFALLHPEAKYDYNNPVWPTGDVVYYWNEPLFGYYTGADYWAMRKHALMLGDAGVDVLLFDCTNGKATFRSSYEVLFKALRDCMEAGNTVPKVAFVSNLDSSNEDSKLNLMRTYFGAYCDGKYSDLWYYHDGKPLIMAHPDHLKDDDAEMQAIMDEIKNFFTFRYPVSDHTAKVERENAWGWLRTYGNTRFNKQADGGYEMATVGVAVNRSYVTQKIDAMNTPYVMGRSYTESLGDDQTPGAYKYGYFFREQLSSALSSDADFMLVVGWNEWKAVRHIEWNTTKNAFPDQYDNNGSRDMEPTRGDMKDNYYCLLVDAVRRFKGVSKPTAASGEITIDLNDMSSWDNVTPEYFNDRGTYSRDSVGFGSTAYKNDSMRNNPVYLKAARDATHVYFMAEAEEALKGAGESSFMNLYIDSDRNHATGWEGYDFLLKNGTIYALAADKTESEVGKYDEKLDGKVLRVKADRALLKLSDTLDFEFKWVDNCESNDILDFYAEGNSAPMGRFNYRYTEAEPKTPTEAERKALNGISLIKAGSSKMMVSGAKSDLSEYDPTAICVEMNQTAYIPMNALTKILGFGLSKVEYNSDYNMVFVYSSASDGEAVGSYTWACSVLGSVEARVNGAVKTLSAPAVAYGGTVYVPVTMLSECFGLNVTAAGNGVYAVSRDAASDFGGYAHYLD